MATSPAEEINTRETRESAPELESAGAASAMSNEAWQSMGQPAGRQAESGVAPQSDTNSNQGEKSSSTSLEMTNPYGDNSGKTEQPRQDERKPSDRSREEERKPGTEQAQPNADRPGGEPYVSRPASEFDYPSDRQHIGFTPEQDYRERQERIEGGRVRVTREGSTPDNNFVMTMNPDGSYNQRFADGRNLDVRTDTDGNLRVTSTGPRPENNFDMTRSTNGRRFDITFADGRKVTGQANERGRYSMTGSGPNPRDNFNMDANSSVTHHSYLGATLDPFKNHALSMGIRALGAMVSSQNAEDVAVGARLRLRPRR